MTQIINKPKDAVSQVLNGVAFIHQERLARVTGTGIITYKKQQNKQVIVISGGGSGHEPAHFGYVGDGMLGASVSGPMFTPPKSEEILQAIEQMDQGLGVLLVIKNFEADVTEFLRAEGLAQEKGHQVAHVIVNDDCSVEAGSFEKRRRGVAGTVLVHKIVGAAAKEGQDLETLAQLGADVVLSMNTLGVALSSGLTLGKENPAFDLGLGEISFGIGIHGEAGYRTEAFFSSEVLANELLNKLLVHYQDPELNRFALLINGLGTTTVMEQYIFANDLQRLMALEGLEVVHRKAGNFMTSTNMAGISVTLLKIKEDKWLDYLNAATDACAW